MKKIVMVAISREIEKEYTNQLKEVFEGYVEIESYLYGRDSHEINGDMVVIGGIEIIDIISSKLSSSVKDLVVVYSTLRKSSIDKLKSLGKRKVHIINLYWFYTMESIELLKAMGVNNLDFSPYYLDEPNKHYFDAETAILMGYTQTKLSGVKEYIDLGWRVIKPDYFREIQAKLSLNSSELEERIKEKELKEAPILSSEYYRIIAKYLMHQRVMAMLNCQDQEIVVINSDKKIIYYNDAFLSMFSNGENCYPYADASENNAVKAILETTERNAEAESMIVTHPTNDKQFQVQIKTIQFLTHKFNKILIFSELEKDFRGIEKLQKKMTYAKYTFDGIIGRSHQIRETIELAKKLSRTDISVLIIGNSGTGKEMFAQAIHNYSKRKRKPFYSFNCGTIPNDLIESELFGYEDGSFTGARKEGKKGLFELANGGTIFLDEIGDAPKSLQLKLLRVLQENEIMRIGGSVTVPIDVRVITATNKKLPQLTNETQFRQDLFYRICATVLHLNKLKERKEDIPLLVDHFLETINMGFKKVDDELMYFLKEYEWSGNIRELKNCVNYLGQLGGIHLTYKDLPEIYQEDYRTYYKNHGFSRQVDRLFEGLEIEISKRLMKFLYEKPMGRIQLKNRLDEVDCTASDYMIRKVMIGLEKQGWIQLGKGRKGSELTPKGREIIRNMNNNGLNQSNNG